MLAQGREEQRPVVFHPKVAPRGNELFQGFFTLLNHIWRLEILGMKPALITTSNGRDRLRPLVVHTEKEIYRSLFVRV